MKTIELTAFDLAQRFIGMKEVAGSLDNPQIMAMLRLDDSWPGHDEVPWCSAFVNYICWLLRLPRSKSLAARSWLSVGAAVRLYDLSPTGDARAGFDVVILKRAGANEPGPEVLDAVGHVGFFAGAGDNPISSLQILGGNQGNEVSVSSFPIEQVLGIRRVY